MIADCGASGTGETALPMRMRMPESRAQTRTILVRLLNSEGFVETSQRMDFRGIDTPESSQNGAPFETMSGLGLIEFEKKGAADGGDASADRDVCSREQNAIAPHRPSFRMSRYERERARVTD